MLLPKVTHLDKHFNVFINGPESFTLFEIHDIAFLSTLIDDENVSKNDRRTIRRFIKDALLKSDGNNNSCGTAAAVIPVCYSKTKNSGQYSQKTASLQCLHSSIKEKVYDHGEYVNLDIVNKAFTIIHEVAKINGIQLPAVKEFIDNRDQIYLDNANCWNNSNTIKHNFCTLLFHPVHFDDETPFISKLIDELALVDQIFQHPDYPEFKTDKIIEIYSTLIMKLIADYLVLNGIIFPKFYSLNGDAIYFQPLKAFEMKDIEDYIFKETNMDIKLH